jgi:hypothetical protein
MGQRLQNKILLLFRSVYEDMMQETRRLSFQWPELVQFGCFCEARDQKRPNK